MADTRACSFQWTNWKSSQQHVHGALRVILVIASAALCATCGDTVAWRIARRSSEHGNHGLQFSLFIQPLGRLVPPQTVWNPLASRAYKLRTSQGQLPRGPVGAETRGNHSGAPYPALTNTSRHSATPRRWTAPLGSRDHGANRRALRHCQMRVS